ncbi:MAG: hypothetical protein R2877_01710 [Bdellovibrionota bacterium]
MGKSVGKQAAGFLECENVFDSAAKLAEFYRQHTTSEVLGEIIRNSQQFSNSYLRIQENPIYRTMSGQKVKIGQFSLGYLVPVISLPFPKSGGITTCFTKVGCFLLSNVLIYPMYLRRRKNKSFEFSTPEKNHLEWLERDLNADGFEEDTTGTANFQPNLDGPSFQSN